MIVKNWYLVVVLCWYQQPLDAVKPEKRASLSDNGQNVVASVSGKKRKRPSNLPVPAPKRQKLDSKPWQEPNG